MPAKGIATKPYDVELARAVRGSEKSGPVHVASMRFVIGARRTADGRLASDLPGARFAVQTGAHVRRQQRIEEVVDEARNDGKGAAGEDERFCAGDVPCEASHRARIKVFGAESHGGRQPCALRADVT
jgi:hypothetical protein